MLSGGAEDVLVLKPDIVVASVFDKRATRELLKANGLRLAELAVPRNLTEVKAPDSRARRHRRASRSRGARNREARRGAGAGAPGRRREALPRAAAVAARLGGGQRQFCRLAAGRNRAVQRRRRSRLCLRRLRLAGGDRGAEARSAAGVAGRRFRARRRPGLSAASGAGAVLSGGKAHRDSGAADRMRRRDAGGSAGCAGGRSCGGSGVDAAARLERRRHSGRRRHSPRGHHASSPSPASSAIPAAGGVRAAPPCTARGC